MPISRYNNVHTGPNIQLGGFRTGNTRVLYHVFMAGDVKSAPMIPASWQIAIASINLYMLFVFMILV